MTTSRWILIALLMPFWWASGLMLLALVADLFRPCRAHVFNLLDRLEWIPGARATPTRQAVSRLAA